MSAELAVINQVNNRLKGVTQLIGWYSNSPLAVLSALVNLGGLSTTSGATVGGVLTPLLSISGAGRLDMISIQNNNTTSKTLTIKITIDGVVALNITSGASATSGAGFSIPYYLSGNASTPQQIEFTTSLLVEVGTSVSDTGGYKTNHAYTLK